MLEFLKEKKLIIGTIIIILIGGIMYVYNSNNQYEIIGEESKKLEDTMEEEKNHEESIVIIHVAGAVKRPGIVKLKEGSRIEDAIKEAGGLLDNADISNINLAYVLEDGTKIKIPTIDEKSLTDSYIIEGIGEEDNNGETKKSKININTATLTELETLDGIGPSLAERIIEYREKTGKFKTIEDIKNVTGIGDNKYESIKNNIKI